MKQFKPKKQNVGTENELVLDKITCIYGTIQDVGCRGFYINVGTWMNLEPELDNVKHILFRFEKELKYYIKNNATGLTSNTLYSLVDVSVPEYFGVLTNQGYIGIEITINLKQPMERFKLDKNLHYRIEEFCREIEKKMQEFSISHCYTLTSRRMKNIGKKKKEVI